MTKDHEPTSARIGPAPKSARRGSLIRRLVLAEANLKAAEAAKDAALRRDLLLSACFALDVIENEAGVALADKMEQAAAMAARGMPSYGMPRYEDLAVDELLAQLMALKDELLPPKDRVRNALRAAAGLHEKGDPGYFTTIAHYLAGVPGAEDIVAECVMPGPRSWDRVCKGVERIAESYGLAFHRFDDSERLAV